MLPNHIRQKSIAVYHLHMGGPDADALEWQALQAPRYGSRLVHAGVYSVLSASEADIVVVTGLLTSRNLDAVLAELAAMATPSVLVTVGDAAINGGIWASLSMPGLSPFPLSHYADVALSVPGNPPTPQALVAAVSTAVQLLVQPSDQPANWKEEA